MSRSLDDNTISELIDVTLESRRFFRQFINFDDGYGMQQVAALMYIAESPEISMKEIAEKLEVSMPAATNLIDRLIALDHVRRQQDTHDRRIVHLALTPEGLSELIAKQAQLRARMVEMFGDLGDEELRGYLLTHRKVMRN